MGTNFGYIRRDQDARVNWQEVGKNAIDTFQAEVDRRQTIKDDIAADSSALDTQIFDNIDSDNADLASEMLSVANLVSEARLRQDNALQNGSLKLRDYTIQRNNLKQGVANISEMNKSKIKIDSDFHELVQSGNINPQSVAVKKYNEQFENLNNFGVQLDEFGNPYLAKRIKITDDVTGVDVESFSTNPEDTYSIKGARANMGQILKQEDFSKKVEGYAGLAGTTWQTSGGGFKTVDDAWNNKNFRKLIEAEIRADLVNPDFASGFAGQYLQGYEYAFLKGDKKAKGNQIPLVQINGRWTFDSDSAQGKKIVNESVTKLTEMTRGAMSRKETPYSASEIKTFGEIKDEKQNIETVAEQIGNIYNGDVQDLKSALVFFEGNNAQISELNVTDDGSKFSYSVTDGQGGKITRTLDRNFGPENFLTQMSKQIGNFDLAQLKGTDAYDTWSKRNNGNYTNLPSDTSFSSTMTSAPVPIEPIMSRQTLRIDEKGKEQIVKVIDVFNEDFDKGTDTNEKISLIQAEFEASGISDASVSKGDPEKFGAKDWLVINVPGVTTAPIIIKGNKGGKPVANILMRIQLAKRKGEVLTPADFGIDKSTFEGGTGLSGQALDDAYNGGKGDESITGRGSNTSGGVQGSMFNQVQQDK